MMPAGLAKYWKTHRRGAKSKSGGRMVKRNSSRRKVLLSLPVAVVAGFMPLAVDVGTQIKAGEWQQAGYVLEHNIVGINPWNQNKWDMEGLKRGLFPILLGFAVHRFIGGSLGLNRALARAGVPILRI